jgi:ApeA N-terminal domain 1
MAATFPDPGVQPGEYGAEWFLDDRTIAGELDLAAGRPPVVSLYGDVVPSDWSRGGGFPQKHRFGRVHGRTRSGMDVVLTDANIDILFPGRRSLGVARHAIVGMGVADVPNDAYPRLRFQITELDLLFGCAPIKSVSWPEAGTPHLHGQYTIEVNSDADFEWEDAASITLSCSYDLQVSLGTFHAHRVVFAPVVAISTDSSLTVDEWIAQWVMPLLRLAALATRRPQRLSWLTVNTRSHDPSVKEEHHDVIGTVFGSGIEQAPYEAEYREEWREFENRPLFTLASLPMPLPSLIRRWRSLESAQNPFIELYTLALRHTDLPARARYLYLMQALEALHSFDHREDDEKDRRAYAARRTAALETLNRFDLPSGTLPFIKDSWSKRPADLLDRRFADLIAHVPDAVRHLLTVPADNEVLSDAVAGDVTALQGQLRKLRNDLSHGNRNYDAAVLRPWVDIAEQLCRAHALRLLDFDDEAITAGMAPPAAPGPPPPTETAEPADS